MFFLYSWAIFHCVYVPQLPYPFICQWTSRLLPSPQFSSLQSLSHVGVYGTPWKERGFLSYSNSWSLLKLMSIESIMLSSHFILCCPLLLLPSIFPSIRVFSNESVHHIRWPKYWSFSFSISPSKEYSGLISFRMDMLDLLSVPWTLKSLSNTTVQKH